MWEEIAAFKKAAQDENSARQTERERYWRLMFHLKAFQAGCGIKPPVESLHSWKAAMQQRLALAALRVDLVEPQGHALVKSGSIAS